MAVGFLKAPLKRKYPKNIANFLSFLTPKQNHLKNIFITGILLWTTLSAVCAGCISANGMRPTITWIRHLPDLLPAAGGVEFFAINGPIFPQTYLSYRAAFDGYLDAIHSGVGRLYLAGRSGRASWRHHMGAQYMYQARFSGNWALNIGTSSNMPNTGSAGTTLNFTIRSICSAVQRRPRKSQCHRENSAAVAHHRLATSAQTCCFASTKCLPDVRLTISPTHYQLL